jgi:hypothetical protein
MTPCCLTNDIFLSLCGIDRTPVVSGSASENCNTIRFNKQGGLSMDSFTGEEELVISFAARGMIDIAGTY